MICLDRPTFTYAGHTYRINDSYRELGQTIATIIEFAIYAPTKQILPIVKNAVGRTYFTHWDNLRQIPLGQIELFGYDDTDPDEPPEPPELDDALRPSKRLTASDIQRGSFWRSRSGLHPVTPVVGLLRSYVILCDNLPQTEQIKMCQMRIKQQRSHTQNLRKKNQLVDIKTSQLIIAEEKRRILDILK